MSTYFPKGSEVSRRWFVVDDKIRCSDGWLHMWLIC